jgi:pyruvate/2-oxoglutarate dehydrogenase complex dihydrolipoamide dehydrogenase (E3) component
LPDGDRSRARVVGVTVVGPQAGELVPVLWLCVRDRLTLAEVAGLPSSPGTAASALARAAAALRAAPARGMHP